MYKVEGMHVYYVGEVSAEGTEGSHLVALATSEKYAEQIAELFQKAADETLKSEISSEAKVAVKAPTTAQGKTSDMASAIPPYEALATPTNLFK